MASTYAERRARLPKWAQAQLEQLERRVGELQSELAAVHANAESHILLDPHGIHNDEPRKYLDDKSRIRFVFNDDGPGEDWRDFIDVRFEHGMLCIHGARALVVKPHVTNMVHVELDER